jgi:hypothetical protein
VKARVVYVDNDPVVVSHASALLATYPFIYAAEGDITRPLWVRGQAEVAGWLDVVPPRICEARRLTTGVDGRAGAPGCCGSGLPSSRLLSAVLG